MNDTLRSAIREYRHRDESLLARELINAAALDDASRQAIADRAASLVTAVRTRSGPSLMEAFLGEYGLSTDEGIALMCLAEALLRVPDAGTIDDLIADKITASDWGAHAGKASSVLVNASTWGLMLTGKVLSDREDAGIGATLHNLLRRVGEPVVRTAVGQAMAEMGRQFVLGESIEKAQREARREQARGYTYSYDMLGEAARTDADARRYHLSYAGAITSIARAAQAGVRDNPGISVKLSALHPRYESTHTEHMFDTLVARTRSLAVLAAGTDIGLNIDAEEMDRLDLSLDVIEAVLSDPALAGWDGFGVVVQAYGRRASLVLDWLHDLAVRLDRRIMVRLVKGAYWDTEIKHAQVQGLDDFPVFTRKITTDVSYIACARKLLGMTDRIYPQFATHNAHSAAAIAHIAETTGVDVADWEFQRLHGMGESLHEALRHEANARCRIYAPVGVHQDLLAYLVRRLLENGANSSFVHQIVDEEVPAELIAADPFTAVEALEQIPNPAITMPSRLFAGRVNSRGFNVAEPDERDALEVARAPWRTHQWHAAPLLAADSGADTDAVLPVTNPARDQDQVGTVRTATPAQVEAALAAAAAGAPAWAGTDVGVRAAALESAADLMELHHGELFALLARESGKTLPDAIAELREAVDFLREYARQARSEDLPPPRGVMTCISPWNFPLAIFAGQIAAALVTGNVVLAKPAEQTPLIAWRAVQLLHEAGVPVAALQLLPGDGPGVGAPLSGDARVDGVCFTGSTETAQLINRTMAAELDPGAALVAETGGINAMLVDSTALPEQVVRDVIASAFQSAGQRCSALRVLYVQEDVADRLLAMLRGAMDALVVGDPWALDTDVGPVIDAEAADGIRAYLDGREVAHQIPVPEGALFVPPTLLEVSGIDAVEREVFGPVLHVARFRAEDVAAVIDAVNARGFGLTFGIHTRLDDRVQLFVDRLQVGNVYVNRNQIGAIVGSQPFGGEGLSGTGPKAGGPHYLQRFGRASGAVAADAGFEAPMMAPAELRAAVEGLDGSVWAAREDRVAVLREQFPDSRALVAATLPQRLEMQGPTGERNELRLHPRGAVLCLGPDPESLSEQALNALAAGCPVVLCGITPALDEAFTALAQAGAPVVTLAGVPVPAVLAEVDGFAVVARSGAGDTQRRIRCALADRSGMLVPLQVEPVAPVVCVIERHVCTDTTAAGGNAALMAGAEDASEAA